MTSIFNAAIIVDGKFYLETLTVRHDNSHRLGVRAVSVDIPLPAVLVYVLAYWCWRGATDTTFLRLSSDNKILSQSVVSVHMEVRPKYLVPDTNCFIDHLDGIRIIAQTHCYTLMVPIVAVMQEQLNECTLKDIPKDADRRFERLYRFTHDFVKLEASGRTSARNLELDGQILRAVEQNPRASVRRIANQLEVSRMLVWRVLKRNFLHPYHFQKVQSLQPQDNPLRMDFCQLMLDFHHRNIDFVRTILFTDEATFTRNGILNLHNMHQWSDENPHPIIENLLGDHLLGPFFLPRRLGAREYLIFLETHLFELMQDVPIALRQRLWYLHDGAPAHFSHQVRRHLNRVFRGRWIGRGNDAPINWPSRSPDLNAADFYLWAY
ncbi:hypothetical protein NQ318_000281 [Aromia moschata]|uniref:Transposase Tc1-like domain-containing protein n=1 Tax=Aromia moschata TaxID=1265417 RepID=A0AAV8YWU7_9CUCU|nr:hypothetical protein NQ318_000281 [Aromia moschata]